MELRERAGFDGFPRPPATDRSCTRMYKGNTQKVMADADSIVNRLKHTPVPLTKLTKEYRCSYETIMKAILSKISKTQYRRLARKKLAKGGIKTRFKKGRVYYRLGKGVHLSPATEFRKGHLPVQHKHVGTITLRNDKCGKQFRWIKVSGIAQGKHKWIPYARFVWEQENGPVPAGHFVIHFNGNTLDDNLENLRLVDRKKHLAIQKERNPGWVIKAARSHKRTCRQKRKVRERIQRAKAKQAVKLRTQKLIDERDRIILKQGIKELRGPELSWWECAGCGFSTNKEFPPLPCPKCNGLNFERIKQRVG